MNNRNGRTLTEVLVVFSLLILMGLTAFSLAISGSSSYQIMNKTKDSDTEARVAIAFIRTKIRQNDAWQSLRLSPHPLYQVPSLVIAETLEGKKYETWIFLQEGVLREALILEGESPSVKVSTPIAKLEGFTLEPDEAGGGLLMKATTRDGRGRTVTLSEFAAVRSGGAR